MQNSSIVGVLAHEDEAEVIETVSEETPHTLASSHAQYTTAVKAYRNEQYLNLTPVQVIDKLYSLAITACKKGDALLARKVINELIAGLNFEYKEVSVGLFRLYQYCKHCIRQNKMQDAVVVLEELRATWGKAFNL
jgi:flagellin-specific chaperone FliS